MGFQITRQSECLQSMQAFRQTITDELGFNDDFYTHKDWRAALFETRNRLMEYTTVKVTLCLDDHGIPCDLSYDLGARVERGRAITGINLPRGMARFTL